MSPTQEAAMRMALEALEHAGKTGDWILAGPAITALEAALAEPVQIEEHCLWARNGNEPCPHVQQAEPVQEPDYWQEEARRYAGNADYWRKRYEALAEPGKGGVTWHRWPGDMPDGTTLYTAPPQRPAEPTV